jgi:putative membrane protein
MKVLGMGAAVVMLALGGLLARGASAQMDPGPQLPGPGTAQSGEIERAPGTMSASNPRAMDQPASMRDSLGAPGQNGQQILDKQFIRTAAEGGVADIKISTLATEKGSPEIKDLAQKMADDHTQMNKDLESVADAMGVMLPKKPNKDQQAEYDKLKGLSGKDFDAEYVTYIAKVHYQDVHNYRMEASVAVDPDLQSEVVKALGTMREHIGLISKTATAEGIVLPPRPQRPKPANASSASNAAH